MNTALDPPDAPREDQPEPLSCFEHLCLCRRTCECEELLQLSVLGVEQTQERQGDDPSGPVSLSNRERPRAEGGRFFNARKESPDGIPRLETMCRHADRQPLYRVSSSAAAMTPRGASSPSSCAMRNTPCSRRAAWRRAGRPEGCRHADTSMVERLCMAEGQLIGGPSSVMAGLFPGANGNVPELMTGGFSMRGGGLRRKLASALKSKVSACRHPSPCAVLRAG
jgi:hypothetical protein